MFDGGDDTDVKEFKNWVYGDEDTREAWERHTLLQNVACGPNIWFVPLSH